jgi:hypothetical protein
VRFHTIVFVFIFVFGVSCSALQAGMYLLTLDYDGEEILKNENMVQEYLKKILTTPEKYTISAYTRRALAVHIQRTPLVFHSFYVITSDEGQFFTLSFSATKKTFNSEGAWAINTITDITSYTSFIYGINEWEVQKIPIHNEIHTEKTVRNILKKINSSITYYYKDHIHDKMNKENCNTSIQNTLIAY